MASSPSLCLLLQLGAAVAAASCLLATSSCGPVDAALPPPPSRDVSATTDDTDVQSTVVVDSGVAALAAASRGSRRLGPPARRLSDLPAAAPASDGIIPADTSAPAASPAGDADNEPLTILRVAIGLVLFFFGSIVFIFLLHNKMNVFKIVKINLRWRE
jgi:hypothetical protein